MARNPPWVEDELLVVLDIYLSTHRVLEETDPRVVEASELLNRLPLHAQAGAPGFRTPDAVVLRMANYRSYDPSTAAKGMTNAGRRAERVWERYSRNASEVRELVTSIRAMANGAGTTSGLAEAPDPDEEGVLEGRLIYRAHRRRERDPAIRARKLRQLAAAGIRPACEACGLVPDLVFGPGSDPVLECHHVHPLQLGERTTNVADVALLCASCHRAIHLRGLLVSVQEMREGLPTTFRAAMAELGAN